ncbi:Dynamin-like GTPase that mediates homotypic ER fusion, partial [Serendipita sp. 400]
MTSYTTSSSPARQSPNLQSSPSNVLLSSSSSSSLLKSENGGINMSQAIAERIQVVDEQKQFNALVGEQITKWGLQDAGFLYNIVAVFGSQSTGK